MSWHFLQGQEAASWEGDCLDGAPSALLRLIPTPAKSCLHDKQTDALTDSRSGMMCGPSTANRGAETSMSSAEASRVRTSAQLAKEQESQELALVCGPKWHALSVRFDRVMFSWKTARSLFPEDLPWSSVILPRWGMMRDGDCWERNTPELPISGIGFGLWPTPTVTGNHNRKGASKNSGDGLATAVKWATPTCHDRKGNSGAKRGRNAQGSECLTEQVGGTLNPTWVEWLMGWPLGWTDCAVLETDKFQQWLGSHGKY